MEGEKRIRKTNLFGPAPEPNSQESQKCQYSAKNSKTLEEKVQYTKRSFYDGKYHGYSVKLQVVREGLDYEPFQIKGPEDVYDFMKHLETQDRERFISILLDSKNRVLGVDEVSVGTLNASAVEPREIFKTAVLYNSSHLIFVHNHPSGDPTPSKTDIEVTKHLQKGIEVLGLNLTDHVVIGYKNYKSLKAENLL